MLPKQPSSSFSTVSTGPSRLLSKVTQGLSDADQALFQAVEEGDTEEAERLLSGKSRRRADVEAVHPATRHTVLMQAVLAPQGQVMMAKLRKFQANFEREVKVPIWFGSEVETLKLCALEFAALHGQHESFRLMLQEGYSKPPPHVMARLMASLKRMAASVEDGGSSRSIGSSAAFVGGRPEDYAALIAEVQGLITPVAGAAAGNTTPPKGSKRAAKLLSPLSASKANSRTVVGASQPEQQMDGKLVAAAINLLVTVRADRINKHRMRRRLWTSLPVLAPEEGWMLLQVCKSIDVHDQDFKKVVKAGLACPNAARALMQAITQVPYLWHTQQNLHAKWYQELLGGVLTTEDGLDLAPHRQNKVIASLLGPGAASQRWVPSGREDLAANEDVVNLAAGGVEDCAIRVTGTLNGRKAVANIREQLRLPTDEAVIRAFNASPSSAMLSNGPEHCLAVVVRHWEENLRPAGNFSHHRQEQLDPVCALRLLVPAVVSTRASSQSLVPGDLRRLAGLLADCQTLDGSSTGAAAALCRRLKDAARSLAGGSSLFHKLFTKWCDLIAAALDELAAVARRLDELLTTEVRQTIASGVTLAAQLADYAASPDLSDGALAELIQIQSIDATSAALEALGPEDAATFACLQAMGEQGSEAYAALHGRLLQLVRRERVRRRLDAMIAQESKQHVPAAFFQEGVAYFVAAGEDGKDARGVYHAYLPDHGGHLFKKDSCSTCAEKTMALRAAEVASTFGVHAAELGRVYFAYGSGSYYLCVGVDKEGVHWFEEMLFVEPRDATKLVALDTGLAGRLAGVQELWMRIELDFGRRFSLAAFMELRELSGPLQELQVVGQLQCSVLDRAKLDELQRCQAQGSRADTVAENLVIIGSGLPGMLLAVHAAKGVVCSGGKMQLLEARNPGGQRPQVVRLDPRWVAMLRFHCGTGFEDIWVATPGQSQPFGGTVDTDSGFVEVSVKVLERALLRVVETSASRGLITRSAGDVVAYECVSDMLVGGDAAELANAAGGATHVVNAGGRSGVSLVGLSDRSAVVGSCSSFAATADERYAVCCLEGLKPRLVMHKYGAPRFLATLPNLMVPNTRLIGGSTKAVSVASVARAITDSFLDNGGGAAEWREHVFRTVLRGNEGAFYTVERHVREYAQTAADQERYRRLHARVSEVGATLYVGLELPQEWLAMQERLWAKLRDSPFQPEPALRCGLTDALLRLFFHATISVLGSGNHLLAGAAEAIPTMALFDHLTPCRLRDLARGDTFLMARSDVEALESATAPEAARLTDMVKGSQAYRKVVRRGSEAARWLRADGDAADDEGIEVVEDSELCELVEALAGSNAFLARRSAGTVFRATGNELVRRASDLARNAAGVAESELAVATSPVPPYINRHALRLRRSGGVFADMGDAQAGCDFARASGLTGAAISVMMFRKLLDGAAERPMLERMQEYAAVCDWSDDEVAMREVDHGHSEGGFVRPGFPYSALVRYLIGKASQRQALGGALGDLGADFLPPAWKAKFAAGLIPRGLEFDCDFLQALRGRGLQEGWLGGALGEACEDHFAWRRAVMVAHLLGGGPGAGTPREVYEGLTITKARAAMRLAPDPAVAGRELERFLGAEAALLGAVCRILGALEAHALKEERTGMRGGAPGAPERVRPIDALVQTEGSAIQGAAVGITQALSFSATFGQFNMSVMQINGAMDAFGLSAALGSGSSAFSTISTSGSLVEALRHKAANWQAQVDYYTDRLPALKRRLFGFLAPERQRELSRAGVNHVVQWLAELHAKARTLGGYYGCDVAGGAGWQMVDAALNNLSFEASSSGAMTATSCDKLLRGVDFLLVDGAQARPYVQEQLARLKAAARSAHDRLLASEGLLPEAAAAADRLLKGVLAWEALLAGVLRVSVSEEFARWRKTRNLRVVDRAKATVQTIATLNELTQFADAFGRGAAGASLEQELSDMRTMAVAVSETHKANLLMAAGVASVASSTLSALLTIAGILTESYEVLHLLQPVAGRLAGTPGVIAAAFSARQECFNQGVRRSVVAKLNKQGGAMKPAERAALDQVLKLCKRQSAQSVLIASRMSASVLVAADAIITAATGGAAGGVMGVGAGATAAATGLYKRYGQAYCLPPDLPATLVGVYRPELQAMVAELVGEDPSPAERCAAWATVAETFMGAHDFEQTIGRERSAAIRQIIENELDVDAAGGAQGGDEGGAHRVAMRVLHVAHLQPGAVYQLPRPVDSAAVLREGEEYLTIGAGTVALCRYTGQETDGERHTFVDIVTGASRSLAAPEVAEGGALFDARRVDAARLVGEPDTKHRTATFRALEDGGLRTVRFVNDHTLLADAADKALPPRLLRVAALHVGARYRVPAVIADPAALHSGQVVLHADRGVATRCELLGRARDGTLHLRPLVAGFDIMLSAEALEGAPLLLDITRTADARLAELPGPTATMAVFDALTSGDGDRDCDGDGSLQLRVPVLDGGLVVAERLDDLPEPRLLALAELEAGAHYFLPSPIHSAAPLALGQAVLFAAGGAVARCRCIGNASGAITLEDCSTPGKEIILTGKDVDAGLLYDPDDVTFCSLPAAPGGPAAAGVPFREEAAGTERRAPCVGNAVVACKAERPSAGQVRELPEGKLSASDDGGNWSSGSQLDDLMASLRDLQHSEASSDTASDPECAFEMIREGSEPNADDGAVGGSAHGRGSPGSQAQRWSLSSAAMALVPVKKAPKRPEAGRSQPRPDTAPAGRGAPSDPRRVAKAAGKKPFWQRKLAAGKSALLKILHKGSAKLQ